MSESDVRASDARASEAVSAVSEVGGEADGARAAGTGTAGVSAGGVAAVPTESPDAAETSVQSPDSARPHRRTLTSTALAAIVGGLLAWIVAGRSWSHGAAGDSMVRLQVTATGNDLSAGVTALGLAALAGALALFATRGIGRRLVGLLLIAAGIGVVVNAAGARRTARVHTVLAAKAAAKGVGGDLAFVGGNAYWLVAAAGGLIVLAAGLLAVLRGHTWPGMSSRYDNPAAKAAATADSGHAESGSAKGLWDALDRGEDPTGAL